MLLLDEGLFSSLPFKDLRDSNIVEVVDCTKTKGIEGDPSFSW